MNCLTCFLGGSSPNGFRTHFNETLADTDFRAYIIKGGPGTGKSSLMRRLSEAFPDDEKELYRCSSDPDSLDAVIFLRRRVIVVDGTAPHCFDPEYPGAVQEIINLGEYWDARRLRKLKDEIIASSSDCLQYHARCRRYITALSSVTGDTAQTGRAALNEEKLAGFTERLAKKLLPKKSAAEGKLEFRQLSAITPKGYITNIPADYTAYLLNDRLYAGSERFLRQFADIAAGKGYTVCVSVCTLHGAETFEHMLIPELKTAFFTANPINELVMESKQPINFRRFYDKNVVAEKKLRIRFNAAAAKNLLEEAVFSLVCAKSEHDRLERFYTEAVDFDGLNRLCYSLISEIKSLDGE